jgi:hypothetical protein
METYSIHLSHLHEPQHIFCDNRMITIEVPAKSLRRSATALIECSAFVVASYRGGWVLPIDILGRYL